MFNLFRKKNPMGTTATITPSTDVIATITNAELAIIKPVLNAFLTSLQQPNENFLSVLVAFKNLQLQALQLDGPAQATLISAVAALLQAKLNSLTL
jgi:hypothetical protein